MKLELVIKIPTSMMLSSCKEHCLWMNHWIDIVSCLRNPSAKKLSGKGQSVKAQNWQMRITTTTMGTVLARFSINNLGMRNLETLGFIVQDAVFHTNDIGTTLEVYNRLHRKSVNLPLKIDKWLDHFKEAEMVEILEGSSRDVNPNVLS